MRLFRRLAALAYLFSIVFSNSRIVLAQDKPDELDPFRDPTVPIERRVDDLISRMTLQEKVGQMMNDAPAIDRLGIPAYDWWNEGLHGVARAGYAAVFPQAIGLAASWDTDLMLQVADVISTEARAKNNEFVRNNDRGRYKGLTFWSPNINIFRDPRWGRGQETYGEDPYLTSRMGVEFVKGLQGNDPKYLKVVATPKHFAVHSGPEPERHSFDAKIGDRDLRETYLPAFRATITEANAASVMCAYNRTDEKPMCANDDLLGRVLRSEWKFNGYIVSDCGAISDIWKGHKFEPTEEAASAVAVKSGTDLACGGEYTSLVKAVKDGLISEAEIDVSLKRLLSAKFRLGMFDPALMVKYARIPFSENDSSAHRELSLKAARESIVLLKNDHNLLPLTKDLRTIAVIGPNADNPDVLLGNYNGQPSVSYTALDGIREKVSRNTKVLYSQGLYPTGTTVEPVVVDSLNSSGNKGLKGEYFNNRDFNGQPGLVRQDEQINFNWGSGRPADRINEDNFSIRWTGRITAPESGKYSLGLAGNGDLRLFVDGKLVVEETKNRRTKTVLKDVDLEGGRSYDIRIEYAENANHYAAARLLWSPPSAQAKLKADAIAKSKQADVVVLVMGISPSIEGEEMDVSLDGFRGGDRTDISLPKPQEQLIKDIHALGKPVVLVLMGGSALAVNWENENLPAIVDAWYPGQMGGRAIADVLFGDYNPSGRLPVTFYKSVNQLPPFEDYRMEGHTYRYFRGEPLYPFGYGLSYSKFAYSNLKLKPQIAGGENLTVTADVQNTGSRQGSEVVEFYVKYLGASVPVPIRSLAGIRRIDLKPGEKRAVSFTLTPQQVSVILDDGRRVIEPGDFEVSVGGEQPGFSGSTNAATTGVVTSKFSVTGKLFEISER